MLDDDEIVIKEFQSIKEAGKYVRTYAANISGAIRRFHRCKGYWWRHSEQDVYEGEEWKQHPFLNLKVSTSGRIELPTGVKTFGKYRTQKQNYKCVTITHPFKQEKSVHRLVAETFLPNVDHKPVVDHIDHDPENNNVKNLRWFTYKENNNHRQKQ